MFYFISTIFGISGVAILFLSKILTTRFDFFYKNQKVFNIIFIILFVFLYNFCIYDYKPINQIPYVLVNIIFLVIFVLVNKILYKNR